jgi:hypothetical protein
MAAVERNQEYNFLAELQSFVKNREAVTLTQVIQTLDRSALLPERMAVEESVKKDKPVGSVGADEIFEIRQRAGSNTAVSVLARSAVQHHFLLISAVFSWLIDVGYHEQQGTRGLIHQELLVALNDDKTEKDQYKGKEFFLVILSGLWNSFFRRAAVFLDGSLQHAMTEKIDFSSMVTKEPENSELEEALDAILSRAGGFIADILSEMSLEVCGFQSREQCDAVVGEAVTALGKVAGRICKDEKTKFAITSIILEKQKSNYARAKAKAKAKLTGRPYDQKIFSPVKQSLSRCQHFKRNLRAMPTWKKVVWGAVFLLGVAALIAAHVFFPPALMITVGSVMKVSAAKVATIGGSVFAGGAALRGASLARNSSLSVAPAA